MEKQESKLKKSAVQRKIAVVRIKGKVGLRRETNDTLKMLKLHKKNSCVVLNETPSIKGMVHRVKDFVTWGEVNDETLKLLEKRSGKKKFCRLNSPKKGYGRKGIKVPFKIGGALGYRKEKINNLIRRMI